MAETAALQEGLKGDSTTALDADFSVERRTRSWQRLLHRLELNGPTYTIAMAEPASASRQAATPGAPWPWLFLIVLASVLPRLPILFNADALFNADEAVNALVIKQVLSGRELTAFPWGAHYYGIVEGLLALPFIAVLGRRALAFKLGALIGFLMLVVAIFMLAREIYGRTAGFVAAGLLIGFSPQLVYWSTTASGGYCLIVAWGTLTILVLLRLRSRSSLAGAASLGFMLGFGLYIYELFLVYAVALIIWSCLSRRPWEMFLGSRAETAPAAWRRLLGVRAVALLGGFTLGFLPRLLSFVITHDELKEPSFGLGLDHLRINANLLLRSTAGMLGIGHESGIGVSGRGAALLALPLAFVIAIATAHAAWCCRREFAGPLRRAPMLTPPSLLLTLLAADTVAFLLSTNPQNGLSSRYLLPAVTSLAVLSGGWLSGFGRRRVLLAASLTALAVLLPLVGIANWYLTPGPFNLLGGGALVIHRSNQLGSVLALMRGLGLQGGYATYWTAYPVTFFSDERILVAPYRDWDRNPRYTQAVDRLPDVAYIFQADETAEADFLSRIQGATRRRVVARMLGSYRVYWSRDGQRLLPPFFAAPVVRLRHAAALVRISAVSPTARPGQRLNLDVEVVNLSDAAWSATGAAGALRVAVAYHWLDDRGHAVVWDGQRSALPADLRPGESARLVATILVPGKSGRLRLVVTLVQEGATWFDQATDSAARASVEVLPFKMQPGAREVM